MYGSAWYGDYYGTYAQTSSDQYGSGMYGSAWYGDWYGTYA